MYSMSLHCTLENGYTVNLMYRGFLVGTVVENLPSNAGDARDLGSIPASGRSPEIGSSGSL